MSAPTGGPGGQLPPGVNPKIIFADLPKIPALATSHGTIMGLVFVVILPLGSFLIRASNSKKSVWAHVAFQLVGWILMFGGLATGIKMAKILDRLHNNAHTILGTVVIAALILQPIFGFLHHRRFKATQQRTIWSHIHVWYGRVLILLGIVNGGLGLHLSRGTPAYSKAGTIAYSVLAGVVGLALVGLMVWVERSRRRTLVENGGEKAAVPATAQA